MNKKIIIAIDGTAASGKGTLARRLAETLNMTYLDTGRLYRYVGLSVLKAGQNPADPEAATIMAESLKDTLNPEALSNPELSSNDASTASSKVAAIPGVRNALTNFQKSFAETLPENKKGAILDGRDIGTVICPHAGIKFFVTADVKIRAERRHKELQSGDNPVTYEAVLTQMRERDARDSGRETAPLIPADDAIMLDTSNMTAEEVFETALSYAKAHIEQAL